MMINACAATYETVPASLAEYLRIETVVVALEVVAVVAEATVVAGEVDVLVLMLCE
jgi:hypothetical protein